MRSWFGLALVLLSSPAFAGSYRVVLDRPVNGRLLTDLAHFGNLDASRWPPDYLSQLPPVAGNQDDMYRKAAAGEGLMVSDNLAQLFFGSLGFSNVDVDAKDAS